MNQAEFRTELSAIIDLADSLAPKARRAALDDLVKVLESRDSSKLGIDIEAADFTDAEWNMIVRQVCMCRGAAHAEN